MKNREFLIVSFCLVFLICISIIIGFKQVSAVPGDTPKYELLFQKILSDPDISLNEDDEIENNGRILSTQRINSLNWQELSNTKGQVIEWADIDIQAINCSSGFISQFGKTSTCQNHVGTYAQVVGETSLPPMCPPDSVYSETQGKCFKTFEFVDCAGGTKESYQDEEHNLYCISSVETRRCSYQYRDGISQLNDSEAECAREGRTQTRKIRCSHRKTIVEILDPYAIKCQRQNIKSCPVGYSYQSGDDNHLACELNQ